MLAKAKGDKKKVSVLENGGEHSSTNSNKNNLPQQTTSYFFKLHTKWRHTGVSQVETIPQKHHVYYLFTNIILGSDRPSALMMKKTVN